MVRVFVPRAGLTGLISTLQKWGMAIADITTGSPSAGGGGVFNVSDGAGGWRASATLAEVGGALDATYAGVALRTTLFRVVDGVLTTFRFDATSTASLLAGRVLSWNGTRNVYSPPPAVLYFTSASSAAIVNISVANLTDAVRTFAAIGTGQTYNLPDSASCTQGNNCVIYDAAGTAGGSPITIAAAGTDTIRGAPSIQITTNFGFARIQKRFGSTDWMVVG